MRVLMSFLSDFYQDWPKRNVVNYQVKYSWKFVQQAIRELLCAKKWNERQMMKLIDTVFHICVTKGPNHMDCYFLLKNFGVNFGNLNINSIPFRGCIS
jgi:hypothetical protein